MGNIMENIEKNSNINIEHLKKIYFWRNAFFGVVILFAGIAIGGAAMSIMSDRKPDNSPLPNLDASNNLMPRLRQALGLNQEQVSKIRPILESHIKKLLQIRENARVDIYSTLEQMGKEINPILSDIQKRVWQQELVRIQRDFNPVPPRLGGGGRRGGGEQPAPGGRRYGGGRGMGPRRGPDFQPPPPDGTDTFYNGVNEPPPAAEALEPNTAESHNIIK